MNKKIILLSATVLIFVFLAITGVIFYQRSQKFNVIKENSVFFKYPKELEIKRDESIDSNGRIGYQIRTKFTYDQTSFDQSYIDIVIPAKNVEKESDGLYTLEDVLKANDIKDYIIPLKETDINGNKGEMVEYRLDREYNGDRPTHSVFSEIYLNSQYSNAPVRLKYEEKDTDQDSLDVAWETILKTLKY